MNENNSQLFVYNRNMLFKYLKPNSIAVLCPSKQIMRTRSLYGEYRQSSNLLYFTGISQEETFLVLEKTKYGNFEYLFIRFNNEKTIIWEGHKLSKIEATLISGIKNVKWSKELNKFLEKKIQENTIIYLEMGDEWAKDDSPFTISYKFYNELKNKNTNSKFEKLVPIVNQLRIIKSKIEIQNIKNAIKATGEAFNSVLKTVKPGLYEFDIEAEISRIFTKNNKLPHSYLPIVASGINSTVLHYNTNKCKFKNNELLLLDFGSEYNGYASDLSRTIPINGKYNKRQLEVYNSVLAVFKEAKKMFVIGNTINNVNNEVGKIMEYELIKLKLLDKSDVKNQNKKNPLYKKYYMHGTSHFIGLDVHDCGNKDVKFTKGMVLSCEPGIYIKEEGFGIRIENDILVDNATIDLMEKIPIEAEEIMEIMKG